MSFKFGIVENDENVPYQYGNVFEHEVTEKWSRVIFATNDSYIRLMLDIASNWEGPYDILYVLKLSRLDNEEARYQAPETCSYEELESFANRFKDYFEGDGRHHLWFHDDASGAQLVYDNHNVIYSYGDDQQVISFLQSKGFAEGFPLRLKRSLHVHCYNSEFDKDEADILKYFDWKKFPLVEKHDDPG